MAHSPFTHPFIQAIMHLTSPVVSNMIVFFSFKANHWMKIKYWNLSSKILRHSNGKRVGQNVSSTRTTTTTSSQAHTFTSPSCSSQGKQGSAPPSKL